MFKRRDSRSVLRIVAEAFWPRGGWLRAAHYVKHRMRRLPGTPEQIARGVFAGAFTVFTPFFGLHFVVAAILAKVMRGSILAALLATFLGNPLTYVPIAWIALQTGHWMLGTSMRGALRGICGTTSSPSSRPRARIGTNCTGSTRMSFSPGWSAPSCPASSAASSATTCRCR